MSWRLLMAGSDLAVSFSRQRAGLLNEMRLPACLSLSATACAMAPWAVDPLCACAALKRCGQAFEFWRHTATPSQAPCRVLSPHPDPGRGFGSPDVDGPRPTGYFSSFLHEFYLPTAKCTLWNSVLPPWTPSPWHWSFCFLLYAVE